MVDTLAKQGAQGGEIWMIPKSIRAEESGMCPIVCALTKFIIPVPDIAEFQMQDSQY